MQLETDREEHENWKDDRIRWGGPDGERYAVWKTLYCTEIFMTMSNLNAYSTVTDLALQLTRSEVYSDDR